MRTNRIKKKNKRKQKIEDIETEAHLSSQQTSTKLNPDISTQTSARPDLEFRELFNKDIFSLEDDNSLLILLTEGNLRQLPFPVVRRDILPVISLHWITKISDIREGNTIEMQIEVPITTRYEELERAWITSRIFEISMESYPSLLTTMQVVPYLSEKYLFNLHIISAALCYKYEQLTRPVNLELTNQGSFQIVRRKTLQVIPLLWITKTSDIRDGNTIEMLTGIAITTKYEELERSWITSRIFECSMESYPSLPTHMQVVPYMCKKSLFYLHIIACSLYYEYEQLGKLESICQGQFLIMRCETLQVIPLLWITKTSDIKEGNTIEMQIEVPITTIYEELERSWLTSRIFETSMESYPSLLTKMQVVPYVCEKYLFNLHIISAALCYKYEQLTRPVNLELTNQGSFQIVRRKTLQAIPLFWINKTSDIREGNTIEMLTGVAITTKYEELERLWITSRIFECSMESYPSLLTHMQVVPYMCKKSLFYLQIIAGSLYYEYEQLGKLESICQGQFLIMMCETLQVIPLLWITKTSDIKEGNTIEMQIEVPITTRYEELERSWITSRIFGCSMESYPSLLSKMQVVPYVCKKSLLYLHLISWIYYYCEYDPITRPGHLEFTNQGSKGYMESADSATSLNNAKTVQVIADMHTIKSQPGSENRVSKLPCTDTLEVNWSLNDITIKEIHLTSLLVEDGDYKKLYKGYYGDTHFVASVYRRIPKKLDMTDLGRLRSPNLPELFGILQYNSYRWIIFVEAKFGDLCTLLKKDPQRAVFGEDSAKFVTVRMLLALAYLQTHGVVHGDVRPSKILINDMGMPMLGGLETVAWSSNRTLVRKSPKSMKIGFVAPEVLTGFRPQQASNIFSLGCVAYFIITGRRKRHGVKCWLDFMWSWNTWSKFIYALDELEFLVYDIDAYKFLESRRPFTKRNELLNKMKGPELLDKRISPAGIEFITACLQKSIGRRFQLGPGLKYVRQNE